MKKNIYKIYKKFQNNKLFSTFAYFSYNLIFSFLFKQRRRTKFNSKKIKFIKSKNNDFKNISDIKIALICDEMTYQDFKDECKCVFITPHNWVSVFENFKPDVFFCESAWSGIEKFKNCWRGKIYRNGNIYFENRKEILEILDYCNKTGVKTVFWNKEDPTFWGNKTYDFINTALKFEYIFTTSKECVEKYKAMNHEKVYVLQFGFSPKLFNPYGSGNSKYSAVFAGSWYADQQERCLDMCNLFDMVLNNNISLRIIDRNYLSNNPINSFPNKYSKFVSPSISFSKLGDELKKYRFGININTVKESETMFARRVFELMACNMIVVSNESIGMKKMFGNKIWYVNEKFEFKELEKKCNENLKDVFLNHTCACRLKEVLNKIEINFKVKIINILIICIARKNQVEWNFNESRELSYINKIYVILSEGKMYSMKDKKNIDYKDIEKCKLFIMTEKYSDLNKVDFSFLLSQYSYVDNKYGIAIGKNSFEYISDANNANALLPIKYLKSVINNIDEDIPKFTLSKKLFYKQDMKIKF